jgi:hypothetical protein
MTARVLFTKSLLNFLKQQGYTHIQQRGIEKKLDTDDAYILVPWKNGIAQFEEASLQLEPIESTDITDMLDVEFGLNFWVELPETVAANFTLSD